MILICYDGSEDAQEAITQAAELFGDRPAAVLTVWQPFSQLIARTSIGFGLVPAVPDPGVIDDASRTRAEEIADEGAGLARGAGVKAEPRVSEQRTTTAQAILTQAEELAAEAIIMGSRGLTGVKSLLLGSVSHDVVQHSDRTVVVVPSTEVAASRARQIQGAAAG